MLSFLKNRSWQLSRSLVSHETLHFRAVGKEITIKSKVLLLKAHETYKVVEVLYQKIADSVHLIPYSKLFIYNTGF